MGMSDCSSDVCSSDLCARFERNLNMLPLAGIRVVDLGSVAMAPYAGQWLGDLGADVIKVEPPAGDSTRRTGPSPEADMAAMFMAVNRNKRSIVLDLKQPEAIEALHRSEEHKSELQSLMRLT